MIVRELTPACFAAVTAIADALPEWFTEDGRRNLRIEIPFQRGFVACDPGVIGFVLYYVCESTDVWRSTGHIAWLGVAPTAQRRGAGRALLTALESRLREGNVRLIQVFTLGDGVDYEPYAQTRAFYRAMGFGDHRVEKHDNPSCPESLVLRKAL